MIKILFISLFIIFQSSFAFAELKEECIGFRADGSYYDKCKEREATNQFASDAL